MEINAKVWGTTKTGRKVHAFDENSRALCRRGYAGPADLRDAAEARTWILGSARGLDSCADCQHRFARLVMEAEAEAERFEAAHAEALEINATPRALVAPVLDQEHAEALAVHKAMSDAPCVCPMWPEMFERYGHSVACRRKNQTAPPVTDNTEEDDMAKSTKAKGPLSPLQHRIMKRLAEGLEHAEIADEVGFSRSYISENVCAVAAKMNLPTTAAAVARYGTYQAHLKAADLLMEKGIVKDPIDDAEFHANHVVEELSRTLRKRAERLLPQ